jgi:hypothetical protein
MPSDAELLSCQRALLGCGDDDCGDCASKGNCTDDARRQYAIIRPLIRDEALEEAAKVAHDVWSQKEDFGWSSYAEGWMDGADHVEQGIRALKGGDK